MSAPGAAFPVGVGVAVDVHKPTRTDLEMDEELYGDVAARRILEYIVYNTMGRDASVHAVHCNNDTFWDLWVAAILVLRGKAPHLIHYGAILDFYTCWVEAGHDLYLFFPSLRHVCTTITAEDSRRSQLPFSDNTAFVDAAYRELHGYP
jgi:hypothetical protein